MTRDHLIFQIIAVVGADSEGRNPPDDFERGRTFNGSDDQDRGRVEGRNRVGNLEEGATAFDQRDAV